MTFFFTNCKKKKKRTSFYTSNMNVFKIKLGAYYFTFQNKATAVCWKDICKV